MFGLLIEAVSEVLRIAGSLTEYRKLFLGELND
jgi:hypothetical protein